ncbi:penicillin acylase family protein [Lutimonas zeaxanthinifaciens]|uniref:penicillin acylase family protein n=1 Tax=Lutimonas zeaxanthinifaciens TaxID=3060215 RepID=UPI00265D10C4|nr:penicillin acylase family protein [Lutimonas sp. YSD2104]WKK65414.1 penicillin acylase family protein [Lutimonas sp. YSD2104]
MFRKILLWLLAILVVVLVVSVIFIKNNKPVYSGTISLEALEEKVTVYFDEYGVPHIFADSEKDAYKALGYVHAQDRLWQMELIRRIAAGRLSEVFGSELVKTDKLFRGMGLGATDEMIQTHSDPSSESYILAQAYLDGINTFIDQGKTPIEFKLVGLDKEHYQMKDIYNVFGYMAFSFAQAHKTDLLLSDLKETLGRKYLEDLDLDINPGTTLIQNSRGMKRMAMNAGNSINEIMESLPVPPFVGSNSWVIGPQKTKNGKVILANDPHIGFSQPSVWYQAHLVTPKQEMYGFHLALSPFPVLGHNYDYAYGITMFENDDIDFYREDENQQYRVRKEVIHVKDGQDVELEVKISPNGPLMTGLLENLDEEEKITMDWTYLKEPSNLLEKVYRISHVKNLYEFRDAVAEIKAPGLNMMYGDARGNIAWFASAQLYEKNEYVHTKFILDGSNKTETEKHYLDFEKNPQAINPSWHYVYSANNQPEEVNDKLYPGYYLPEDRAKRIVKLLKEKDTFSLPEVQKMIVDDKSAVSPDLVKIILDNISKVNLNDTEKDAIEVLKSWDGSYKMEEAAPTIYFRFVYLFLKNTFEDEMGEERFEQFLQTHLYKRQIARQLKINKSVWWDDISTKEIKELKDEIITRSFHEAVESLKDQFGSDASDWKWSKALTVEHKHAFDKSGALRSFFNVGPFHTHGGLEVINNQLFKLNNKGVYKVHAGPSTRRIIDFSDVENAKSILPTGQSGNVFSKHYSDQAEKYLNGGFVKMKLNKQEIRTAQDVLVFLPVKDSV